MRQPLLVYVLLMTVFCQFVTNNAFSQTTTKRAANSAASTKNTPQTYRSQNFAVHTDLPKEEAEELLDKLENMLKIISTYWGVRNRKTIECYVIKNLSNWSGKKLDPRGVQHVRGGGGVTMSQAAFRGNRITAAKAIVYATSIRNVPQHEAVHAYCAQNFGRTGPVWYSEGMAEMGQYWKEAPKKGKPIEVNCESYVIRYIRNSQPKSLRDIVDSNEKTGDSWQNYSWRWALCHLLATNPNYSPRFRTLGLGLLNKRGDSFKGTYGTMADEISFEYKFFLQHLEKGFRVDLCSWDWKTKFRKLTGRRFGKTKINAGRGWQASRVIVEKDKKYQFTTEGTWKIEKGGDELSAEGNEEKEGKLMGVILTKFELGEQFELGKGKTFTAPEDGKLYLRCQDKWNQLADNDGHITVTIRLK